MTPREVIEEVRSLLLDEPADGEFDDAAIVGALNQAINRAVMRRPDLFSVSGEVPARVGQLIQNGPPDCFRILDVVRLGRRVLQMTTFEAFQLTSTRDDASALGGQFRNWARYPKDQSRFICTPAPDRAESFELLYARKPLPVALTDGDLSELESKKLTLATPVHPALVYGTAAILESANSEQRVAEHVALWQEWFDRELGLEQEARQLTDRPDAAVPEGRRRPGRPRTRQ